jgi:NAD(P)-dependent dehydrogenase (short-subunit alcohol dehydrogenase family)
MLLQGKVILIVGAAGRLGQILVEAALDAGARVCAADCNIEALERCFNPDPKRLYLAPLDFTDANATRALLETLTMTWGGVDGAVNTAYPRNANFGKSFLDVRYEDFGENLAMHVGGYFVFTQQCFAYATVTCRSFSLINVSSIYGHVAPRFDLYTGTSMTMPVEYAAIKAGINHLTRYACAAAKGSRFRANVLSPGGILSDQPQVFLERYKADCLSKGMLNANDITGTALFLLSDASLHVVGQNLVIDDGFSL